MSLWLKKAIIIISLKINITSANLKIGQSIFLYILIQWINDKIIYTVHNIFKNKVIFC